MNLGSERIPPNGRSHSLEFGITPCQESGRYRDSLEQVRLAETVGFDSAWLYEHHVADGHYFPTIVGLTGFAASTKRLRLGTGILALPLHQPVRVAEDLALLDEMSEGRLEVGVGLGYRPEEFAAFQVPFEGRGRRLEESTELMLQLWSGEPVTFHGKFFDLDKVQIGIRPVQSPRPRLWVAGWSPRSVRRSAKLGDAWIAGITGDTDKLEECISNYYDARREFGKPVPTEIAVERETFISDDNAALERAKRCLVAMYRDEHLAWKHDNVANVAPDFKELNTSRFLVGTPEEVLRSVLHLRDEVGVTNLLCRFHFKGMQQQDVLRSMELFAEKIIPQARNA